MINSYNPYILKVWKANMDIQYIVDPYACIMYIASYVLKQERTMSDTLKRVSKECEDQGIRTQLRKVGSAFLNTREVSAQEVVYRLLSIPLKQFSRKVIFVNTNPREQRVSILKPMTLINTLEDDDENIFQLSLLDRYTARPDQLENLCLAEFAAWYSYTKYDRKQSNESGDSDDEQANSSVIVLKKGLGFMRKRKKESVLRFATFKRNTDLKLRGMLMLYLPWRDEVKDIDMVGNLEEYVEQNRELLEGKERMFTNSDVAVDESLERLQEDGPPTHMWDHIAPSAQHADEEAEIEGRHVERNIDSGDIEENAQLMEGNQNSMEARFTVETKKTLMAPEEYRKAFQGLNEEQKHAVLYNRQWCCDALAAMRSGKPVIPYHIFLSGPGGVDKSHVIKLVHNDILRIFRLSGLLDVDDIPVLLTGPTGTNAFAIGGLTVHAAFFFSKLGNNYQGLSSDKLNTLRMKLAKLQVLVIDEVSMIGSDMLYFIHRRLDEIKGLSSQNSRFGNISIFAVGDLFQLKPVKQLSIFEAPRDAYARLHGSIWIENFKLLELKQIMRQRDDKRFAELLNRVRLAEQTKNDLKILKSREIAIGDKTYEEMGLLYALHVFAMNKDVDKHNVGMLQTCSNDIVNIEAIDSTKDEVTKQLLVDLPDKRSDTGGLVKTVNICVGARIMLTYNLDVSDGLVNGACGEVKSILRKNSDEVETILIKFDNPASGKSTSANSVWKRQFPDCVPIERIEASFRLGRSKHAEVTRKQFPLTLSWAQTIHKTQGQTVPKVVINMKRGRFQKGQAYVALSRVTSLQGLFIVGFDPNKITADNVIKNEMQRLKENIITNISKSKILEQTCCLKIAHLNICGLLGKMNYLTQENVLQNMDVVCFCETSLSPDKRVHPEDLPLRNADVYRLDRASVTGLENVSHGGVMILVKKCLNAKEIVVRIPYMEVVVASVPTRFSSLHIISAYRRPNGVGIDTFLSSFSELLAFLPSGEILIVGDFNVDVLTEKGSKLENIMEERRFKQMVEAVTSDRGTCIDHMYFEKQELVVGTEVHDCFYSDHKIVVTGIKI